MTAASTLIFASFKVLGVIRQNYIAKKLDKLMFLVTVGIIAPRANCLEK